MGSNVGSHSSTYVRFHPLTPTAIESALTCRPLPSSYVELQTDVA
jgi:hypothetical protein